MSKILIVRDVVDFGVIEHPRIRSFGIELCQSLIHNYLVTYTQWGVGYLDDRNDYEGFVATVLENTSGFNKLSDVECDVFIHDSIKYLHRFIDYVENKIGDEPVRVIPPAVPHRRIFLLVG